MKKLKEYSQRYEGKQIWLTEFAIAREPNVTKIVEFVEGEWLFVISTYCNLVTTVNTD